MRPLILMFALAMAGAASHAGGQPKPTLPTETLPNVVVKNGVIVVRFGSFSTFKPEGNKKLPIEVLVSQEDVLGARPLPADPTSLLLVGKAVGTATLTIAYDDKTKEKYEVVVEAERPDLTKRLRPGFVAFTLGLSPENAVGGYLGFNDHVAIYSTKSADPDKKTVTLMKNVRVLAVPYGNEARLIVPLEVTTDEAKQLRSATESGTLALGLLKVTDEKTLQDRKGDDTSKK